MRELGKNIILNINNFKKNTSKIYTDIPHFEILTPQEIFYNGHNLNHGNIANSLVKEKIYRINEKMQFKDKYKGFQILGIAICNMFEDLTAVAPYWSSFILQNKHTKLVKAVKSRWYLFHSLDQTFYIDDKSYIFINNQNITITEGSVWVQKDCKNFKNSVNNLGISYIFLSSSNYNFESSKYNFKDLSNENIEIPEEYNFNHLIPPVEWYKEIIDEYCSIMDPKKLAPLQKQITEKNNQIIATNNEKQKLIVEKLNLQTQINQLRNNLNSLPIKKQQLEISNLEQDLINKKLQAKQLEKQLDIVSNNAVVSNDNKITIIHPNTAKSRIQNQLSYKLGQAMIVNSKSLLGYIRMPFVLSYIKDKHKQEQKIYQEKIKKDPSLKLPPLESYPDYKEALKEKECLTYKLGEALIKASNNWYGGGYIKLLLEIRKLKKEFREKEK